MDPVKPASSRVAGVVPPWIRGSTNLLAMVVTAVLVGLLVVLIGWLSPVLAPLGLGMFLAALAAPLFSRLAERGYSPPVALTVTIGVLVLVIGGIVLLAITSARTLAADLAGYSDALEARLAAPDGGLAIRDVVPPGLLVDVLRVAIDVVTQVGGTLLFAMVVAALLLLDAPRLTRLVSGGLGSANPVFRQAPVIASAAVTYFVVRIRVNALTAISLFLLMVVVGVDHAPLWAVGAFFLSFVPYLGLIIALIPPTILAFAEFGPGRGCRHRHRRNRPEPGRRERPRADPHGPGVVARDVARVRDVLLLGLADGAHRCAPVDADLGPDRAGPPPQHADPMDRRAARPRG